MRPVLLRTERTLVADGHTGGTIEHEILGRETIMAGRRVIGE